MTKKIKENYIILAVDTSCDETSVAITGDDQVLANVVASQIKVHQKWGGVVPHLARREHKKNIDPAIQEALIKAKVKLEQIDALAVTEGPGLAPALEVGIKKVKEMALKYQKPVISVNHMEGHLLSSFAKNSVGANNFSKINAKPEFPILGLLVSGGHTQLVLMEKIGKYKLLGETLDDAAGEAFDKVAKMLDLGYPGGPIVSQLAQKGKPIYDLPVPMKNSPGLDFSFSGLKTACLYKIKEQGKNQPKADRLRAEIKDVKQFTADFCASFEKAAVKALILKLKRAIKKVNPKQIVLGGGVISNPKVREAVRKTAKEFALPVFIPYSKKLFTDNAAMIGVCAFFQAKRGNFVKKTEAIDRKPNLNFK